jgi:hypothetical protein
MICNIATDISTKTIAWTVTDIETGRFIQCVPAHMVPQAMRLLQRQRPVAK